MDALTRHGPLKPSNPKRILNDFIVIAPQLPVAGSKSWQALHELLPQKLSNPIIGILKLCPGDNWYKYSEVVISIVSSVRQEFHGDLTRTYLTGFSYGGNGVLDLAATQENYWAAYWPVDPVRVALKDLGRPIWMSVGHTARKHILEHLSTLNLEQPGADIFEQDRVYTDQGLDHVGTASSAYSDNKIYDWLLSKRLQLPEGRNEHN
jgi:predicted peptidase